MVSAFARSTLTGVKFACTSAGAARSQPLTRHPCSSKCRAIASPIPELLPVTSAWHSLAACPGTSLGTDAPFGNDLGGPGHVVTLEARKVVHRPAAHQQALLHQFLAHLAAKRLVDLGVQALCNLGGQLGRAPQTVPAVELVAGDGPPHRGHLGHGGHAPRPGARKDLEHAPLAE